MNGVKVLTFTFKDALINISHMKGVTKSDELIDSYHKPCSCAEIKPLLLYD